MSNESAYNDKTILRVGSTLLMGKYRIEKCLSSGGFSNTYLGVNVFNEQVAIKEFFLKDLNLRVDDSTTVSLNDITQMPIFKEQMEKFKKEAKRLRSLHSPHIVSVSDLFDENGTTYYVMDYIDGLSLRDMVKLRGKLVEQEVLNYLNQTLDALEEMHRQDIFHLDLKPANLMVDKKGVLRIIDFAASKQQNSEDGATSWGDMSYSPAYAPIEQECQEFENVGPWTDLYALGATLYNVLTDNTPPSTSKILESAEGAFQFPPTVSEKMKKLILWMMQVRRVDRPQSVADVRKFLNESPQPKPKPEPPINDDSEGDETILNGFKPEPKPKQQPVVKLEGEKKMSVAKVLPDTIGDIIYFDTTNEKAEPTKTRAQYIRNRVIAVIVTVLVLGVLYYLYVNEHLNGWGCGALAFFTILGGIGTFASQVFEGTDYFIGLEGFAVFKFKNERDNLVKAAEIKFDDFDYLLHEETDVYENNVYEHTSYIFSMLKYKKRKEEVFRIESSYVNKDNYGKDVLYNFARQLEKKYTDFRYIDVLEQFTEKGSATFTYFDSIRTFEIVLFTNGDIKVDGILYKYDEIESIFCDSGNLVIARQSEKIEYQQLKLKLGSIGNRLLLLDVLVTIHKKMRT